MSAGDFSRAVRVKVLNRAGRQCERCGGLGDWRGMQFHHRRPRQMGGSRDAATGSASNCLYVCAPCHYWIESHRDIAYQQGWLVRQGHDPAAVPVRHRVFGWVTLTDQGSFQLHNRGGE